jgi:type II pantothenate kinase
MLEISQHGDNRNVDLLVGDIYGSDYSKLGLKSSKIASSFGKVFRKGEKKAQKSFKSEDISRSLLYMIRYAHASRMISYSLVFACIVVLTYSHQ